MVSRSCFTFVRNLQSVFHLRPCIENTRCFNSRCPLLDGSVQLFPASFHSVLRVLMYLSPFLIMAVANELATLRCVSLAVSASQETTWDGFRSRYSWSSFLPCWCQNWLCSAGSCFHQHPKTGSHNSFHCTSSKCSATQSCLLDVAARQCLLVFELLSCEDQSLLVGMNTFLVFTLMMTSLAFVSHHWNASCCCC